MLTTACKTDFSQAGNHCKGKPLNDLRIVVTFLLLPPQQQARQYKFITLLSQESIAEILLCKGL